MPYKDPARRRQHDRERRRAERAELTEVVDGLGNDFFVSDLPDEPTVQDVTRFLSRQINRISRLDGDEVLKARTMTYMVNSLLKSIESGGLEERIASIEAILAEDRHIA